VVPGTQHIRFGLTTIKNFGQGIADAIINERKENGPYESLIDFLSRVHDRNLNKKSLEALIQTGALDRFEDRGLMYGNVENLLAFNKAEVSAKESSQVSLFGGSSDMITLHLEPVAPLTSFMQLTWEKELLGVYVSGHPLDDFEEELNKPPRVPIEMIKQAVDNKEEINIVRMKGGVVTAGMIETVRELLTKKGERMAFIQLLNKKDRIEMTAFPETYRTLQEVLKTSNCVAVKGKLQLRNDEPTILIDNAKLLGAQK